MVIGLFPELEAPGGIQRVGRHVGAVTAAWAAERGKACRFFSLNDPPGLHRITLAGTEFVFTGYERGKGAFAWNALRAAGRRGERSGLVIAAHVNFAPVAALVKARRPGWRMLVLTHGVEVWTPLGGLRRWALRRADLVLAPSRDTAEQVVARQGIPKERVRQMAWGLDPILEMPDGSGVENHLPKNFPPGRVVLTVGQWRAAEKYKGLDTLISALPRLLQKVPDAWLVAVGGGDDRERLEELARQSGVGERVRFLDGLTQQELRSCYARCEVFALPSKGEGFGLVFLEAMAAGKPVVGGAHGGTPDVVEHGVTGMLVPHGEAELLAGALERLLMDVDLSAAMGQRGRERVEQIYRFEHFSTRLKEILGSLCAS